MVNSYRNRLNTLLRQYIKLPLIKFIDDSIDIFINSAKSSIRHQTQMLLRLIVITFVLSLLLLLSILMYASFYNTFIPHIAHERPVYFYLTPYKQDSLTAHLKLTKEPLFLMLDQPYNIYLNLEVPESPVNQDLGMFTLCVKLKTHQQKPIVESCRMAMLHYKSPLYQTISTLTLFSPVYLFSSAEEKQNLQIQMFDNYIEDEEPRVTNVEVVIRDERLQLYSAKLLIKANMYGLRYFMFNFPFISTSIGIFLNIFVIVIVCISIWYQLVKSEDYREYRESKELSGSLFERLPDSTSSSSIEDITRYEGKDD